MAIPFDLDFDAPYERLVDIAPGIRRLLAKNPSPFTFKGTGVCVVGGGRVAVIDPGPDDPGHLRALREALKNETVTHILITHTHRDHSPAAQALKEWTGAKTYGFGPHPVSATGDDSAVEEGGDRRFVPDIKLHDGDVIEGDGFAFQCIHTPGHISNHMCFAYQGEGALFTGDHVMGWSTSVVAPPAGDMGDYLHSLRKLLVRDDRIYWPTHGGPIRDPKPFVAATIAHRHNRETQILAAMRDGVHFIPDLVARIYTGLDPRLRPAASLSVLAHLELLLKQGRAIVDGAPPLSARFSAV